MHIVTSFTARCRLPFVFRTWLKVSTVPNANIPVQCDLRGNVGMFKRILFFVVIPVALMSGAASGARGYLPPIVTVPKLSTAEIVGTTPQEAVMRRPASIPRFEYFVFGSLPTQQTEVRLAYDDANLYVAFTCFQEQIEKLVINATKRDQLVTGDDSVSVFLDPDNDHRTYYQVACNAAGVQYDDMDERDTPESWNADWSVVTSKGGDRWTAVFTIPFKSLGMTGPRERPYIGINFSRITRPFNERSVWTTVRYVLRDPDLWGHLVFAPADSAVITEVPDPEDREREFAPCRDRAAGTCSEPMTPISCPGPRKMTIAVSNPSNDALHLKAEVLMDNRVISSANTVLPKGKHTWSFTYNFPTEGEHELKLQVKDARSGRVLTRTPYTLVYIRRHNARIAFLQNLLNSTSPASTAQRLEKINLQRELDALKATAKSAVGSKTRWEELGKSIRAFEKRLGTFRSACADKSRAGYSVGTASSLYKILRDEMFEGDFGKPARIELAKNEYESVQAVVSAHGTSLKGVTVQVTPLRGPGGAVIQNDRVKLNLVDFVQTRPPRYAAEYLGWMADPLMPMSPFDVDQGKIRPIWITIHAPEGIPAGVYKATITVRPSNAPSASIPLEVRVRDFVVPTRPAAKTAFAFFEHEMRAWYGDYTPEMRREWYAFLLEHKINPTNIYSGTPVPDKEDLPFCVERGLNAFTLVCTWYKDGKPLQDLLSLIREYRDYLKPRGWWDMPFVYGFDELSPDKYPELRATYGEIHKEFPDLKRMTTVHPNKYLKGYVDIWVPLTANYQHEVAQQYRKDGDEVWWYVCCHPHHPYPNFFVDYPPIDQRILWWMNWKYDVPGVLYYAINLWESNRVCESESCVLPEDPQWRQDIAAGKRWPEVEWNTLTCATWNGDGHLVYPGPGGHPVSSIRLEAIRDGIEDYEYFRILRDAVAAAAKDHASDPRLISRAKKLLKVRDDVVTSTTEYTMDPSRLFSARAEIADLIEQLSRH